MPEVRDLVAVIKWWEQLAIPTELLIPGYMVPGSVENGFAEELLGKPWHVAAEADCLMPSGEELIFMTDYAGTYYWGGVLFRDLVSGGGMPVWATVVSQRVILEQFRIALREPDFIEFELWLRSLFETHGLPSQ